MLFNPLTLKNFISAVSFNKDNEEGDKVGVTLYLKENHD